MCVLASEPFVCAARAQNYRRHVGRLFRSALTLLGSAILHKYIRSRCRPPWRGSFEPAVYRLIVGYQFGARIALHVLTCCQRTRTCARNPRTHIPSLCRRCRCGHFARGIRHSSLPAMSSTQIRTWFASFMRIGHATAATLATKTE